MSMHSLLCREMDTVLHEIRLERVMMSRVARGDIIGLHQCGSVKHDCNMWNRIGICETCYVKYDCNM